jgi:hypothetical protein
LIERSRELREEQSAKHVVWSTSIKICCSVPFRDRQIVISADHLRK